MKARKPQAKFTYGWLATAGALAVVEAAGIYRNRRLGCKDTATAHIRRIAGIDPIRPDHMIGRAAILAGCCWAGYHLALAPAPEFKDQPCAP